MRFFLIIIFTWISFCAHAQSDDDSVFADTLKLNRVEDIQQAKDFSVPADTLAIAKRDFDEGSLQSLKSDTDLNYKQPPTVAETLWDRFKIWLSWILASLIGTATTTDVGKLLIYILAAVIVVGVIMALLKVNAFKVFYSGADQGGQGYQVFHENIHEMDFDKLIQEAVNNQDYRIATRLIFLHALKLLSDKHLIEFKPGKTNHDYVEELNAGELKTGLNELSFYFDYAWYGNFRISSTQFEKITAVFNNWRARVSG